MFLAAIAGRNTGLWRGVALGAVLPLKTAHRILAEFFHNDFFRKNYALMRWYKKLFFYFALVKLSLSDCNS